MIVGTLCPWSSNHVRTYIFFKVFLLCLLRKQTHMANGIHLNSIRDFQTSSGQTPALPVALSYTYQVRTIWPCKKIRVQLFLCQIATKQFGTICYRTQVSTLMAYMSRVNQLRRNVQLSILLFPLYMSFYNTQQQFILWFLHSSDFISVLPSDSPCKCEIWNDSFCGQWQSHLWLRRRQILSI